MCNQKVCRSNRNPSWGFKVNFCLNLISAATSVLTVPAADLKVATKSHGFPLNPFCSRQLEDQSPKASLGAIQISWTIQVSAGGEPHVQWDPKLSEISSELAGLKSGSSCQTTDYAYTHPALSLGRGGRVKWPSHLSFCEVAQQNGESQVDPGSNPASITA